MAAPIQVAILGFSTFERNALAAHFRIAHDRSPRYALVLDVDEAVFVIADADQRGVADLLRAVGRMDDTLFVGASAPPEAAAWTMRPIDPATVMREFDQLLRLRENAASRAMPLGLPSVPGTLRALEGLGSAPPAPPIPARRAHDLAALAGAAGPLRGAGARRLARGLQVEPTLPRVLLVDDSEIALHFLRRRLEPFGVETDFAYDSAEALERLESRTYGLVFLDVDLGEGSELDGLALCKRIRSQHWSGAGNAPVIILVSAFHDAVHRVRGTLAGADAFLSKPLEAATLANVLAGFGLRARAPAAPA